MKTECNKEHALQLIIEIAPSAGWSHIALIDKLQGLFLEGARWNRIEKRLDESSPKVLFDSLPIITMTPTIKSTETSAEAAEMEQYDCPIYKTTERRGVLATTGHSSNFVMFIQLSTDKKPNHWINRGTASILSLDDWVDEDLYPARVTWLIHKIYFDIRIFFAVCGSSLHTWYGRGKRLSCAVWTQFFSLSISFPDFSCVILIFCR